MTTKTPDPSKAIESSFDVIKDLAEDFYDLLDRFDHTADGAYLHLYHIQDLIHNSLVRNGLWDTARRYQDYNELNYRAKENFLNTIKNLDDIKGE